jgi:hypothetical protein
MNMSIGTDTTVVYWVWMWILVLLDNAKIILGQYFIIMLSSKDTNNFLYDTPPNQMRIHCSEMIPLSLIQFDSEY